jgi:CspA family cold shock protein
VKFFNTSKGYGFIAPAGGGNDVFVHVSALQRSGLQALNEGQQVEYETETSPQSGKLQAIHIRVL